MKTLRMKILLVISTMLFYVPLAFSHTGGEHGGGLLQQLMHILQSADHLFIILAMGVLVGFMIRRARKQDGRLIQRRQAICRPLSKK